MRILLVCSYPPPYAGMSIYAERLSAYLNENGHDCAVIDIGREKRKGKAEHVLAPRGGRLLKYLSAANMVRRSRPDVLQIACSSYGNLYGSLLIAVFARFFGIPTIFSIRGGSFPKRVTSLGFCARRFVRWGLSFPDRFICVNERIRDAIESLGVPRSKISVIPAFCLHYLNCSLRGEQLPQEIVDFCASKNPVLVSGIVFEHIYGWETLLAAFAKLRARHNDAGLIIMGKGPDRQRCAEMVEKEGLSEQVLMAGDLPHPVALTVCKEFADVMVRPTLVDGDSAFVREALALCKPVVASDTDFRPDGCILFRKGDPEDLAKKLEYALEHSKEIATDLRELDHPDYFAKTVMVYESLLGNALMTKTRETADD